jgi:hypothetical protein
VTGGLYRLSHTRHAPPAIHLHLLPTLYLLPTITVPGLLLLFPLDCACGGSVEVWTSGGRAGSVDMEVWRYGGRVGMEAGR